MRKLREKAEKRLSKKKPPNPINKYRRKIKRSRWLFARLIIGKKPPNLIGWFEKEKPTFLDKTEQTSNPDGQGGAKWENK